MRNEDGVVIRCDCGCTIMTVEHIFDDCDDVYINFYADRWHSDQTRLYKRMWQRIKLAMKVLFNGTYLVQSIVACPDDVEKMRDYLNRFLEKDQKKLV